MKIGILGTGTVGRTLATRLTHLGHEVTIGTRDVAATMARGEDGESFADWAAEHPGVRLGTHADAARHGELVVNATSGQGALAALTAAGADNLAGKVLLDICNPLDFSRGFPPTLSVVDTDSLAEQIQRAFPDTRVVKSLNTVTAGVMVDPQALGADSTLFLSGDDADAKAVVLSLLQEMGWVDVLDLGDITTARGAEMYLPLWLRVMQAIGTPTFNVKVVR